MSKPLSITIPDELKADLDRTKHHFNVSATCASALRRKVDMYMQLAEEDNIELVQAAVRLRCQRLEGLESSEEIGFRTGHRWLLEEADYEDVKWFVNEFNTRKTHSLTDSVGASVWRDLPEVAEGFSDVVNQPDVDATVFWVGFMKGVMATWKKIADRVE